MSTFKSARPPRDRFALFKRGENAVRTRILEFNERVGVRLAVTTCRVADKISEEREFTRDTVRQDNVAVRQPQSST